MTDMADMETETSQQANGSSEPSTHASESPRSPMGAPTARAMQSNWLNNIWQSLTPRNRLLTLYAIAGTVAKIVSIMFALIIARHQSCDRPFAMYLIVYLGLAVVSFPVNLHKRLRLPRIQLLMQNTPQMTTNDSTNFTGSASASYVMDENFLHSSGSSLLDHSELWIDRFSFLLDLVTFAWFVVGNYYIFSSTNCASNAPSVYYTCLVWILAGYVWITVPFFIYVFFICCLPCTLVAMQLFRAHSDHPLSAQQGTPKQIAQLPVWRFQPAPTTTSYGSAQLPSLKRKRRSLLRQWFRSRGTHNDLERCNTVKVISVEDAVCAICLSEYENDDLVCTLCCGHHFHKECVHIWLALNSLCPLCKHDFRE